MKIKADFDKCKSVATCESLAPGWFEVDDRGFLDVRGDDVDAASLPQVEQAVASCPNQALSLEG